MTAPQLHVHRVLSVNERACRIWVDGQIAEVRFSVTFPTPRVERVAPGHLVAVTSGLDVPEVVVWRWFDAVVVGPTDNGLVPMWEPTHGQITAHARESYEAQEPGFRAYASAGLPGADWWVACAVTKYPEGMAADLEHVTTLYNENDLWRSALDVPV